MSTYANLPAPSPEQGLNRYMQEIRKFPLLEPEEEYMLAKRWVDHQDTEAAHRMVTSHLRLAAKIAMGYRGYGLPQAEVISEANVGLMQAVKRFDPEKGFRLATYAMWWIRASIQEYILRSWILGEAGHHLGAEKAVFQPAQGQGQGRRAGRGRSAARERGQDRHRSERDRGRGHLDEPPPGGLGRVAERDGRLGGRRRRSGRTGWRTKTAIRPTTMPRRTSWTPAAPCWRRRWIGAERPRKGHPDAAPAGRRRRSRWKNCRKAMASAANASARSKCAPLKSCRPRCANWRAARAWLCLPEAGADTMRGPVTARHGRFRLPRRLRKGRRLA